MNTPLPTTSLDLTHALVNLNQAAQLLTSQLNTVDNASLSLIPGKNGFAWESFAIPEEKTSLKQLETLVRKLSGKKKQKLAIPVTTGQTFIEVANILFVRSRGNFAHIHLANGEVVKSSRSLSWIDELLTGTDFCRIHNSYLVNFNHIKEYIRQDGGYVVMCDGKVISISRRRKDSFLAQLAEWNEQ